MRVLREGLAMRAIEWVLDRPLVFFGSLLALCVGLLSVAATFEADASRECVTHGGHWVKTGESTVYVLSGKIMIPVTTETRGCAK
jgi:hypothetical protein